MRLTKHIAVLLLLLAVTPTLSAQQPTFVDDEECGCETVLVDGIQTYRRDSLYGFRLVDGTDITPPIYRYVDRFHNGYCKVYLDEGQCGLIDRTGRQIVPCRYDDLSYPSEGRILAIRNSVIGYCDMQGQEVIAAQFPQGASFSSGCAAVQFSDGRCAFIDTLGQQLFGLTFDNLRPFSGNLAIVRDNGLWGVLSRSGDIVLPLSFPSITEIHDGLFLAGEMHHMALYDSRMQPLSPSIYSGTLGTTEGRVSVVRDGRYGFLDASGNEIVPCIYDETGLFKQGRTLVRMGDHYGIIDTLGRIILPIEYDDHGSRGYKYTYFDSRALVEKNGKLSFVDLEGNLILPLLLEDAYQFADGLAAVRHKGLWGYIDTAGDTFIPCLFDQASPFQWGRAEVIYNGTVSKIDRKGRCVKNCNGIIAWREINE